MTDRLPQVKAQQRLPDLSVGIGAVMDPLRAYVPQQDLVANSCQICGSDIWREVQTEAVVNSYNEYVSTMQEIQSFITDLLCLQVTRIPVLTCGTGGGNETERLKFCVLYKEANLDIETDLQEARHCRL
ncbi:hypothetical protein NHQ30_001437 [Ciborinia camelliae]|nr:hypothetical protein NHQ30_001437 [Ciborinia camelliae]